MKSRSVLWHLYLSLLAIVFAVLLAVTWYESASLKYFYHNQVASNLEQNAHLIQIPLLQKIQSHDFSLEFTELGL